METDINIDKYTKFKSVTKIYDAKTILDLYTANITKNLRFTYIPLCYVKSLKIKQKQNDIVYGNRY